MRPSSFVHVITFVATLVALPSLTFGDPTCASSCSGCVGGHCACLISIGNLNPGDSYGVWKDGSFQGIKTVPSGGAITEVWYVDCGTSDVHCLKIIKNVGPPYPSPIECCEALNCP